MDFIPCIIHSGSQFRLKQRRQLGCKPWKKTCTMQYVPSCRVKVCIWLLTFSEGYSHRLSDRRCHTHCAYQCRHTTCPDQPRRELLCWCVLYSTMDAWHVATTTGTTFRVGQSVYLRGAGACCRQAPNYHGRYLWHLSSRKHQCVELWSRSPQPSSWFNGDSRLSCKPLVWPIQSFYYYHNGRNSHCKYYR